LDFAIIVEIGPEAVVVQSGAIGEAFKQTYFFFITSSVKY